MKNKLIILTCIIFFIGIFFIFDMEGFEDLNNSMSIKNVNTINNKEFENIKNNRLESKYDLIDIKYKNNEIPYDSDKNIYYISKYNNGYDFDVFYSKNTIVKSIKNSDKNLIKVIAYNKNKYKIYNICLSEFPIVNINLNNKKDDKKELISENYVYGNVSIFDNEKYKNKLNTVSELAKLKTRGISSQNYEKKSYSIQFINSKSGEKKLINGLLGFDNNNTFALNSLYEDDSKIRDIISLNCWKNINQGKYNEINMKYVEVIINNKYYGLYGLSEIPNEYKLNVYNKNSIIYKINDDIIPELSVFDTDKKNIYLKDHFSTKIMEMTYINKSYEGMWNPLKDLTRLVYYENDKVFKENILNYIDIDNCVDYFILQELTYDIDGLWKNGVFTYNEDSKKFIRTPWDLDFTFGKHWDESDTILYSTNNMDFSKRLLFKTGNNNLHIYLEQRLWENNVGNFRQKVAQKWSTLRKGFLQTDNLVNYANSLYDEVTESGAREREHERWPDGGYSTDNKFIETFIRQRLEYLDGEFLQYLDDDTGGN